MIEVLVRNFFGHLSDEVQILAENELNQFLSEGKDLGNFKGEISPFKQQAIRTAHYLPKPVSHRRQLEKDSRKELDTVVNYLIKRMTRIRHKFKEEDISKTQFRKKMKAELSTAYSRAYKLGTRASGLVRASDLGSHIGVDERKWLDKIVRHEQGHFNRFLKSIESGESKKKSLMRIKNYASAVKSVFDASRMLQLHPDSIIHWVLESGNPCEDCRTLHRMSPFTPATLPTTPKGGSTRCLANCACRLRIVRSRSKTETQRVARRNRSAKLALKKLKLSRAS